MNFQYKPPTIASIQGFIKKTLLYWALLIIFSSILLF